MAQSPYLSPSSLSLLLQTALNNDTTLAPPLTLTPTTEVPMLPCDGIRYEYEVPIAVVCGMCFVFGIIFTFFGYRCFKAIMFLIGFLLASVVIFLICLEESTLVIGVNVGISVGVGVVCGLATMLFKAFGLFATGFHAGVLLAGAALVALEQVYHPDVIWVPLGTAFGVGAICGLATLKWQRHLVIIATAIVGGAVVATCADYYLELFRMVEYVYDRFRVRESHEPCWYSWLILGTWPIIMLLGIVIQYRVTARGYSHKDGKKKVKSHHVEMHKLSKQQSKDGNEVRLQKYQNLYRVRRCNGDVVAVSYLQSIQNHLSPEMQRIASTTHLPPEPIIAPPIPPPPETTTTTLLSNASTTITTVGPVTHIDDADIADV
ncbi:transmembrane protein 198-like [Acanthaster planci]|uniref:Transmembrane protein 198 n=1 Tax=Acanthaster planci TaxID=133434 RepID=A0A8B7YC61_ACAPL|nr:transmembrane protein 198-like [Acanthaster planci]XP_022090835.1 transmembrane protein 198-like [Acanthaster planci]XP_022090836.1 transmembrane protein 198-like [Acanthaster planci]XP_022090837.1 transmembrane protein 198-like [Acanthaster planci]XP_022090838.1 transmembrane protein 198-like [Acanthaster planci]XP_022090839.1 transmembrane protein 198-like [Acanthaster planci]